MKQNIPRLCTPITVKVGRYVRAALSPVIPGDIPKKVKAVLTDTVKQSGLSLDVGAMS